MNSTRSRALLVASIAVIAAAALALAAIRREPRTLPPRPPGQRPALMLLTSLPLIFSEDFSLGGGSPALEKLTDRYRVVPISVTSAAELAKGRLLLMAQPLAQAPENLVALDEWVRSGGRVMLLADPMLEWPSKRRLGDPLRPAPMFADTGLLAHWGLRLDAPDARGPMLRQLAGRGIETVSPGALSGRCAITADRLVAQCAVGQGKALVVADADFLNLANIDGPTENNLPAFLSELERLGGGEPR
ncbi:MAG: hypothetical protein ACJ8EQ_01995 [Sphingomicrobium sp.]